MAFFFEKMGIEVHVVEVIDTLINVYLFLNFPKN